MALWRFPLEARQLLDPVLERMMAPVHRYEGTVNQMLSDGIMALFGTPIAHAGHAVRACYAALAMQASVQQLRHLERGLQACIKDRIMGAERAGYPLATLAVVGTPGRGHRPAHGDRG